MTDQHQDENKLIAERRAKLAQIRENCSANGFPNQFRREAYAADLQEQYGAEEKAALAEQGTVVAIAGRVMAKRGPFLLLQDMTGQIQRAPGLTWTWRVLASVARAMPSA